MMRLLWLGLLLLAGGCEDNEHPFGDGWSVNCTAPGAPPMVALFARKDHIDDKGGRRQYLGRVDLEVGDGLVDVWIWQVELDVREGTVQTVSLERTPMPDDLIAAYDLKDLSLDPEFFAEDEERTFAEMDGSCAWGDTTGDLFMRQDDNCDLCPQINCSTIGWLPTGVVLVPVFWGLWGRRRRRERA